MLSTKTRAGLNMGTLCAGTLIVVPFEMLRAVFYDERSEAPEKDGFAVDYGTAHALHEFFEHGLYDRLFDPRGPGDFVYDFCFCHGSEILLRIR